MISSCILMQLFEAIEIIYIFFFLKEYHRIHFFIIILFTVLALLALASAVIPVLILCKVGLTLNVLLSTRKATLCISFYSS